MQCSATITQVNGPVMLLQLEPADRCHGCTRAGGCGAGVFMEIFRHHPAEISVPRLAGSEVGSRVLLEIADAVAVPLAFIGFLMPVLLLLAGGMLAQILLVQGGVIGAGAAPVMVTLAGIAGFVGGLIAYSPLSRYVCSKMGSPFTATGFVSSD